MTLTASPSLSSPASSAAPRRVSTLALLRWTLASLVVTAGIMSAALLTLNQVDWWRGFLAASSFAIPVAFSGLAPVLFMIVRGGGAPQIAFSFLAGLFLRILTVVLCLVLAVYVWHLPRIPTVMLLMAYYAVLLVTEVVVLVIQMRAVYPVPANLKPLN